MNHYSHYLVQSKLDDYRREAVHMNRVAEARRASRLAWVKSASAGSWSAVRRTPSTVAALLASFAG
jgi:hypothetical protein